MEISQLESQLLPCPFCGSRRIALDECTLQIMCGYCLAKGPVISRVVDSYYEKPSHRVAIEAWNTRQGKLAKEYVEMQEEAQTGAE